MGKLSDQDWGIFVIAVTGPEGISPDVYADPERRQAPWRVRRRFSAAISGRVSDSL